MDKLRMQTANKADENFRKLAAMFPIPENNAFYGCMLLGYPTEEYFYIPRRLKLADIKTLK